MRYFRYALSSSAAALLLSVAGAVAAQPANTHPIPIQLAHQQWCAGPPYLCYLDPLTRFDFGDDGDLAFDLSLTTEQVDGKLVYRVSGTATNRTDGPLPILLTGQQYVTFSVPRTFVNGAALPTTLVISSVTADPSELPDGFNGVDRVMTFAGPDFPQTIVSEALGQNLSLRLNELYIRLYEPRNVELDTLVAGDQIRMGLLPRYTLTVKGDAIVSFDETITYELRFAGNRSRR